MFSIEDNDRIIPAGIDDKISGGSITLPYEPTIYVLV